MLASNNDDGAFFFLPRNITCFMVCLYKVLSSFQAYDHGSNWCMLCTLLYYWFTITRGENWHVCRRKGHFWPCIKKKQKQQKMKPLLQLLCRTVSLAVILVLFYCNMPVSSLCRCVCTYADICLSHIACLAIQRILCLVFKLSGIFEQTILICFFFCKM